jgi:hypothetical protein
MGAVKNFTRFGEHIVNRRPFPELLPVPPVPAGEPVFERFMELRRLFNHFGELVTNFV